MNVIKCNVIDKLTKDNNVNEKNNVISINKFLRS